VVNVEFGLCLDEEGCGVGAMPGERYAGTARSGECSVQGPTSEATVFVGQRGLFFPVVTLTSHYEGQGSSQKAVEAAGVTSTVHFWLSVSSDDRDNFHELEYPLHSRSKDIWAYRQTPAGPVLRGQLSLDHSANGTEAQGMCRAKLSVGCSDEQCYASAEERCADASYQGISYETNGVHIRDDRVEWSSVEHSVSVVDPLGSMAFEVCSAEGACKPACSEKP
jgi:hypothetical protein